MDYIEKVAKEFPEVKFFHCTGYKTLDNINYFRWYLIIKTNQYTGNFEREFMAFVFGYEDEYTNEFYYQFEYPSYLSSYTNEEKI